VTADEFKRFVDDKFMKKLKAGETTGMNLSHEIIKIQLKISDVEQKVQNEKDSMHRKNY